MKTQFFNRPLGKLTLFFSLVFLLLTVLLLILIGNNPDYTPPSGAQLNFQSSAATEARIVLNWRAVDKASLYELYRAVGEEERVRVYSGSGNTFADSRHAPAKRYTYWVNVIFLDNFTQEYGPFYVLPQPAPPPAKVHPLQITFQISGEAAQFGVEDPNRNTEEIRVLRKGPGERDFRLQAVLPPGQKEFRDEPLIAGKTYRYRFITVFQGRESDPRELILKMPPAEKLPAEMPAAEMPMIGTPPVPPVQPASPAAASAANPGKQTAPAPPAAELPPPTALAIDFQGGNYLQISWEYAGKNIEQVIVERKSGSEREFRQIKILPATESFFLDTGLSAVESYQYRLIALYQDRRSVPSAVLNYATGPGETGENNAGYFQPGKAAFESGDHDRAEQDFRKIRKPENVVEQGKEYLPSRIYLGRIALKRGNYREAAEYFQEASRIEPGRAETYYWWGFAQYQSGDYRRAIEMFEKVFKYQGSLSAESFDAAIFNTHYGIIDSYYHLWQAETEPNKRQGYGKDCFDRGEHFLNKYGRAAAPRGVEDFHTKCQNVNIFQQNINNFSKR